MALWVYSTTGPRVVNLAARILESTASRWTHEKAGGKLGALWVPGPGLPSFEEVCSAFPPCLLSSRPPQTAEPLTRRPLKEIGTCFAKVARRRINRREQLFS